MQREAQSAIARTCKLNPSSSNVGTEGSASARNELAIAKGSKAEVGTSSPDTTSLDVVMIAVRLPVSKQ